MLCQSLQQFVLCLLLHRYSNEKRICRGCYDWIDLRLFGSKSADGEVWVDVQRAFCRSSSKDRKGRNWKDPEGKQRPFRAALIRTSLCVGRKPLHEFQYSLGG
jgi:hypothetical protein